MSSLVTSDTTVRVSSTLNRDVKNFGPKFMLDGSDETCWNSDQGSPQHVIVNFNRVVHPKQISVMFQGGFVGKNCDILVMPEVATDVKDEPGSKPSMTQIGHFYPEDTGTAQLFELEKIESGVTHLKLVFPESTDFFGRVCIYTIDVVGSES
eukprot:m.22646 g.22646  ORF g.22646 m.22646 type:complete len:152 (+) comp13878_c0_seq1:330-785(+)